jgi:hypothetical protein
MTQRRRAREIRKLRAKPPITTALEHALGKTQSLGRVWYKISEGALARLASEYDGPGHYDRENWNRSAKFFYNHINCAPMVLWLGEASGIPKLTVVKARQAALSALPNNAAQCAAIRRIIPWEAIEVPLCKTSS